MPKRTAERILDAAEEEFAERGFDAASLGDVADRVGIRPQAIYNHFASKRELYAAVLERLLDPFLALLDDAANEASAGRTAALARDVAFHARNPHLARILQYATLGGGEPLELIQQRWYRPFFERALLLAPEKNAIVQKNPALLPWMICAFHSLILGYATMAPLHRELLGIDPFSAEGIARQTELLQELLRLMNRE
ncbi:MAG TPA: helix-turn-helix domain-containing protein [Myxococcota bacterium]|nr:helix-turn-helix domain-containing protein [Myxococcota bacterium]